jgi:hypothetical protein
MACDPNAPALLAVAGDADRRQPTYWLMAYRQAKLSGTDIEPAEAIFTTMTSNGLLVFDWDQMLNPLNENGTRGSSGDRWGYRRQPMQWPSARWEIPSQTFGLGHLLIEPKTALGESGLGSLEARCR